MANEEKNTAYLKLEYLGKVVPTKSQPSTAISNRFRVNSIDHFVINTQTQTDAHNDTAAFTGLNNYFGKVDTLI